MLSKISIPANEYQELQPGQVEIVEIYFSHLTRAMFEKAALQKILQTDVNTSKNRSASAKYITDLLATRPTNGHGRLTTPVSPLEIFFGFTFRRLAKTSPVPTYSNSFGVTRGLNQYINTGISSESIVQFFLYQDKINISFELKNVPRDKLGKKLLVVTRYFTILQKKLRSIRVPWQITLEYIGTILTVKLRPSLAFNAPDTEPIHSGGEINFKHVRRLFRRGASFEPGQLLGAMASAGDSATTFSTGAIADVGTSRAVGLLWRDIEVGGSTSVYTPPKPYDELIEAYSTNSIKHSDYLGLPVQTVAKAYKTTLIITLLDDIAKVIRSTTRYCTHGHIEVNS